MKSAADVLNFWFVEHGQDDWFGGKAEFDVAIEHAFGETHLAVAAGEAWQWRETAEGRLAEIIVLDQFSRQLYRGSAKAFASDAMALALAQEAVAGGYDQQLEPQRRMFLYMPYMHSESLVVHEESVRLFTALGMEETLQYELAHLDVLKRFGRYPRRNAALGRTSTSIEAEYCASDEGKW
ncbi:MAG TPA: DUF924 family protein [Devosia sp.]